MTTIGEKCFYGRQLVQNISAVFLHDLKKTALLVVRSQKTMVMKRIRRIAIFFRSRN
jgi:hypothetical protein